MPVYIIAEHDVHDQQTYNKAIPIAAAAIKAYKGRYLVNGRGATELVEGTAPPKRIVVLEFPTMEAAKQWYASEEYREGKAIRHSSTTSRIILAEGC